MDVLEAQVRRDKVAFGFLLAFAVVLYAIPGEWISELAPLRLALVTSGAAAGLMVLRRLARMEPVYWDGLRGAALIGFLLLGVASQAWSVSPAVSQDAAIDLLKAAAIYLAIINVVSTPRRLAVFALALIAGSLFTSIGAIEWYLKGENLVEGYRARWHGTYADPNYLAEHLSIVIPLCLAFVVRRGMRLTLKIFCAVAAVLAIIAIVYTHSRGGFIGLSVGILMWALCERTRRMHALTIGAALAVGLLTLAPQSFWTRTQTVEAFHEDESAMGRVHAWAVTSAISIDKPLLGVGLGGFQYAWPLYAPPEATKAYVAHNLYLTVIGELGFVGLFMYLIFSGGTVGGAFAAARDPRVGWLARGVCGGAASYLTCNLFAGSLAAPHLYVLVGMAAAAERLSRGEARETVADGREALWPAEAWGVSSGG